MVILWSKICELYEKHDHKQIVLIGHSKGAVDITSMLSMQWKPLKDKVKKMIRGVISVQAPFAGALVAEQIVTTRLQGIAFQMVKGLIHGDPEAIRQISYTFRRDFLHKHPYPVEEIDTVCFTSSTTKKTSGMYAVILYCKKLYPEVKSDGLVCEEDGDHPRE